MCIYVHERTYIDDKMYYLNAHLHLIKFNPKKPLFLAFFDLPTLKDPVSGSQTYLLPATFRNDSFLEKT